jgi:hypothetical protein
MISVSFRTFSNRIRDFILQAGWNQKIRYKVYCLQCSPYGIFLKSVRVLKTLVLKTRTLYHEHVSFSTCAAFGKDNCKKKADRSRKNGKIKQKNGETNTI